MCLPVTTQLEKMMAVYRVKRGTMPASQTAHLTDAWFATNVDTSKAVAAALASRANWRKESTIAQARVIGATVCQPCKAIKWELIGERANKKLSAEEAAAQARRRMHRPLGKSLMAKTYYPVSQ
jgi:hypothetical protein